MKPPVLIGVERLLPDKEAVQAVFMQHFQTLNVERGDVRCQHPATIIVEEPGGKLDVGQERVSEKALVIRRKSIGLMIDLRILARDELDAVKPETNKKRKLPLKFIQVETFSIFVKIAVTAGIFADTGEIERGQKQQFPVMGATIRGGKLQNDLTVGIAPGSIDEFDELSVGKRVSGRFVEKSSELMGRQWRECAHALGNLN